MTTAQTYMDLLDERVKEIIFKTKSLDEETVRWKPSEKAWSILEIVCHVEEFINFWIGEIGNVIHHSSARFGRSLNDQERHATVKNANNCTVEELLDRLELTNQQALKALSNLTFEELEAESEHVNPKFGIKPMTFVLDKFVLEHMGTHLMQMERNIRTKNNN